MWASRVMSAGRGDSSVSPGEMFRASRRGAFRVEERGGVSTGWRSTAQVLRKTAEGWELLAAVFLL